MEVQAEVTTVHHLDMMHIITITTGNQLTVTTIVIITTIITVFLIVGIGTHGVDILTVSYVIVCIITDILTAC